MRSVLVCPRCRSALSWSGQSAACAGCGAGYPAAGGAPALLDRGALSAHAAAQASEHDGSDDVQLELERPRGTPALYGWMLAERFWRSVHGVDAIRPGAVVVTVCGGSGMDAELLAAMGCRVIATDVSVGATQRSRERAGRHGLDVLALAAAAERLPLGDAAVDVAYVHDGLHHLEDPLAGLREMARVSRHAVVVSEPGVAAATRLAVRARIARDVEPGGNRVARLDARAAERELRAHGFSEVRTHRYGMHYRPGVGPLARGLSRRRLLRPAARALLAANRVAGAQGNKLVVQGIRREDAQVGSRQERFSGEPSAHPDSVCA